MLFYLSMNSSSEQKYILVSSELLKKFMIAALVKIGVPKKDALICADVTLEASKRGIDSHGIERFKSFYYDRVREGIQQAETNFEIVKQGPTTAVIDGHNGMGQVIATKAMNLAIKKAKKYGMGMTVVRNSTHYGIAGYYTGLAAQNDMIGISGTNTRPAVAPTNGVENMLGTNPLAFGMPTDETFPFTMDAATSLAQRGKIELYAKLGKKIPSDWVIDNQGKMLTDPNEALDGLIKGKAALTPMGGVDGHKGYGYATVVEILSAALQQGSYLKMLTGIDNGKKVPYRIGHFFIAIDISAFIEPQLFKKTTGNILRSLRASKKIPGKKRIYTAGEKEYVTWLERNEKGIPINRVLQNELLTIRNEQTLTQFIFPF